MSKSFVSPRAAGLFQASIPFKRANIMAPMKMIGHATTRVTPTRMTISRKINIRLVSVKADERVYEQTLSRSSVAWIEEYSVGQAACMGT
jgi:hypothetical protein